MKTEVKEKWVAALRSGQYPQARGVLNRTEPPGFCCLGVLCELAAAEGVVSKSTGSVRASYGEDSKAYLLPYEVQEWAGVDESPVVVDNGYTVYLTEENDGGQSFKQIADLIEKGL